MASVIQVDAREMKWPGPMKALTRAYRKASDGDTIELLATECAIEAVAKDWCERTRNKMVKMERNSHGVHIVTIQVEKGAAKQPKIEAIRQEPGIIS